MGDICDGADLLRNWVFGELQRGGRCRHIGIFAGLCPDGNAQRVKNKNIPALSGDVGDLCIHSTQTILRFIKLDKNLHLQSRFD